MDLGDIFDVNIIKLNVAGTTKDEVLRELSQLLLDHGYISEVDQFVQDIDIRESLGITGAGNHIAIPHGKSSAVRKITIAVGRSDHMVDWESYDDEPVNFFFLFCVSDDEVFAQNHMKLLAELARKIGSERIIEQLQHAKDPQEIIAILTQST